MSFNIYLHHTYICQYYWEGLFISVARTGLMTTLNVGAADFIAWTNVWSKLRVLNSAYLRSLLHTWFAPKISDMRYLMPIEINRDIPRLDWDSMFGETNKSYNTSIVRDEVSRYFSAHGKSTIKWPWPTWEAKLETMIPIVFYQIRTYFLSEFQINHILLDDQ